MARGHCKRTQEIQQVAFDVDTGIVDGIAQGDDGLCIAFDGQGAREKHRVAVDAAFQQVNQCQQGATDRRHRPVGVFTRCRQARMFRVGIKNEDQGKVDGVNQENSFVQA